MISEQQKKPPTSSLQQYNGSVGIIADDVTPLLLLLTSLHPCEAL